jgi:hypothetical protein
MPPFSAAAATAPSAPSPAADIVQPQLGSAGTWIERASCSSTPVTVTDGGERVRARHRGALGRREDDVRNILVLGGGFGGGGTGTDTGTGIGTGNGTGAGTGNGTGNGSDRKPIPTRSRPRRFFGSVSVNPQRLALDVSTIAKDLVAHLAALPGSQAEIQLDLTIRVPGGVPDHVIRIVGENAKTLKFTSADFDAE